MIGIVGVFEEITRYCEGGAVWYAEAEDIRQSVQDLHPERLDI